MRILAVILVLLILIPSTQAYDEIPTVTAKWVYQCETDPLTDKKTCFTYVNFDEEIDSGYFFGIIYHLTKDAHKKVSFKVSVLDKAETGYIRIDGGKPRKYDCNNSYEDRNYCLLAVGDDVLAFTNTLLKAKKIYIQVNARTWDYMTFIKVGNLKEVKMPF